MSYSNDSFNSRSTLDVNGKQFSYYAVNGGELANNPNINRLPVSIKILLEKSIAPRGWTRL